MKKFLTVTLLVTIFLVGCNGTTAAKTYAYEEGSFSLNLPAEYIIDHQIIEPKTANAFSIIQFNTQPIPSDQDLAKVEENIQKSGEEFEKDFSWKTISSQNLTINGYKAAKIVRQHPRSSKLKNENSPVIEVEDGYTNKYTYVLINGDHLLRIWTFADNFSNPEKTEKDFDEIIKTIKFTK